MRDLVRTTLIVGLASTIAFAVPVSAGTLDVPFHRQNTPVWCWAASIAMVVEYLTGTPLEDCEVLARYDAALGGPGACCAGDRRCMRASMPGEIGAILGNVYGLHGSVLNRGLSWNEIVDSIDADKPIIAWVWNSPSTAHVVVISGYTASRELVVLDPMQGSLSVPYAGFASNWGPSHNWNISWVFNNTSGDTPTNTSREPATRTVTVRCTHPAHPAGDVTACVHGTMHAYDQTACTHTCFYYGRAVQCHAYDVWPCQHPVHPYGDVTACVHPLHPQGDTVQVPAN